MSFRIEDKLHIENKNLIDFKEFLLKKKAKKIHQPRIIESLYFDNTNFQIYNDSVEGLVPRKKIRVRNYPETEDKKFYLEIKNSSLEGRFKTREIIEEKKFKKFIYNGIFDQQYGTCFPVLHVKYLREYLILGDVRISIDKNITYRNFKTNNQINDDRVIAELKTSINKDIDNLIEEFPIQRIRFSKYCFAIERLNYQ